MAYLFEDRDRKPDPPKDHDGKQARNFSGQSDGQSSSQYRARGDHIQASAADPPVETKGELLAGFSASESASLPSARHLTPANNRTLPLQENVRGSTATLVQKLAGLKTRNLEDLSQDQALQLAIEAAELNIKFMKLAESKREKADRRVISNALLNEAEQIKKTPAATWSPAKVQNLIDLEPIETVNSPSMPTSGVLTPLTSAETPPSLGSPFSASVSMKSTTVDLPAPIPTVNLSKQEDLILWRGSSLRGGPFPPWRDEKARDVNHGAFAATSFPYEDRTDFRLSADQQTLLDGWKRPAHALPPPFSRVTTPHHITSKSDGPTMSATGHTDLVQDAASNCSLVASMCSALARTERGYRNLISSTLHPWDDVKQAPSFSSSGKYIVKLNFNGCFRKVIIDDRLPRSKTERLPHVIDRNNPTLLWPALVEKAYMKIRGGFDFPGSNSGTDLWTMTGWIPEQCHLRWADLDADALWKKIRKSFEYGDVLITIGTAKLTAKTEKAYGLVSEHAYAVLDVTEAGGSRTMLVKNPWANGTTWRSGVSRPKLSGGAPEEESSNTDEEDDSKSAIDSIGSRSASPIEESAHHIEEEALQPGSFWMKLEDIVQSFEVLYLNWNPGLFKHRNDVHFVWELSEDRSPFQSCRTKPQYSLTSDVDESVWVLLSRHFRDSPKDEDVSQRKPEYISLYAYKSGGKRVIHNKRPQAFQKSPFFDSHQTLIKLDMSAGIPLTIVGFEEDFSNSKYTFTLSAFARNPLTLVPAKEPYSDRIALEGHWTHETSGISSTSVLYRKNLQYTLYLPAITKVALLLETLQEKVSVNVRVFRSGGERIKLFQTQDLVADSGKYHEGCGLAETKDSLPAGAYTIVCSTLDALHDKTAFQLHAYSHVNASLNPSRREGSGRFRQRLSDVSFAASVRKMAAPIVPQRYALLYLEAILAKTIHTRPEMSSSPVRLTIELGTGQDRVIIISSSGGMFKDASDGIRTEDCNVSPQLVSDKRGAPINELWLVLERMGGDFAGHSQPEERFHVDAYSDNFNWAQMGVWRQMEAS